jgi:hypothetical protein
MPEPLVGKLSLSAADTKGTSFEIAFKERGQQAGTASFRKTDTIFSAVSVRRSSGVSCRPGPEVQTLLTRIAAAGTVDLAGDGNDEIFVLNEDGGTGSHDEILLLLDPRDCSTSGLIVTVSHQATRATTPTAGVGKYGDPAREAEKKFLEGIKYRYGYIGPDDIEREKDNPLYAYYFWARDNGSLTEGRMKIRRFKGKPESKGSVEAELKDGPVTYTAQFKAGVVAYNAEKDQHYVLFHPQDMYSWPTVLAKAGHYLIIGTRGEGAAAVDLKTFRLKRFRFGRPDDDVKTIDVKGSSVLVNGTRPLKLP